MAGQGIKITLPGVFSNYLDFSAKMPQQDNMIVYATALLQDGKVPNAGTGGDGKVVGKNIDISDGRVLTSDPDSYIQFPDVVTSFDDGSYTVAVHSKSFARGGFGGFVSRSTDDDSESNSDNRYLAVNGPSKTPFSSYGYVGMRVTAGATVYPFSGEDPLSPDDGLRPDNGADAVLIVTYDAANERFFGLTMTPDGGIKSLERSYSDSIAFSGNTMRVEWPNNNKYSGDYVESSKLACWTCSLTDDECVQAAQSMLGISNL